MEITGEITKVLDVQKGTSKAGKEWVKQLFVVTTKDEYNNLYCFDIFGEEKVENFAKFNKLGDNVKVEFNVNTNEWEGKYFTSLQSWRIDKVVEGAKNESPKENESTDDLPF